MTDMPGAVGSGRAPDPIGRPRSGYLLTCPRTGARPGSRWRPAARRPIGKFCAYQGWLHRVPVATPNTSSTIVGEGSLTGLFTGLSSGDPQRPSRRACRVLPLVLVLALRRTDRGSRVLPPNRRAGTGGRTRAAGRARS